MDGFLLIVLHTHQPFVARPGPLIEYGEHWLFEVITESYIPLVDMCDRFLSDGVPAKLAVSLTPPLTSMLSNDSTRRKYLSYADERIATLERAVANGPEAELHSLARMHLYRFQRARDMFERLFCSSLIAPFRRLEKAGLITLLASSATHAFLPLWQPLPEAVQLQVAAGTESHRRVFGKPALGFWLPECGIYPGIDSFLHQAGIKYVFVDGHALLNASPRPVHSIHAPVHTPAGVAAFARDAVVHDQVWRKTGYPGDPAYLAPEHERSLGVRLFRSDPQGRYYNPAHAYSRCVEHARHFVQQCRERIQILKHQLAREPLIVAMFDTEHFGHWWHEGPQWLDLAIRLIASEAPEIRFVHAEDYLRRYPTNQEVTPSMSSWGWQGYGETWLMGRNDWIYRELYDRFDALQWFLRRHRVLSLAQRAALNQYLREFLLAQSSDWAYMLHQQQNEMFVVRKCFENMDALLQLANGDCMDMQPLYRIETENCLFPDLDLLSILNR